jgi:hypothetical protein
MGTVTVAVAEHGRGGIIAAALGEDCIASPDNYIVVPSLLPIANPVMAALGLSAPILLGRRR